MDIANCFNRTLDRFGVSAKFLARESGVNEVMISHFPNGKQVQTDTFGRLLGALPFEARKYFFESLLGASIEPLNPTPNLDEMVVEMNERQMATVLGAIAERIYPKI